MIQTLHLELGCTAFQLNLYIAPWDEGKGQMLGLEYTLIFLFLLLFGS